MWPFGDICQMSLQSKKVVPSLNNASNSKRENWLTITQRRLSGMQEILVSVRMRNI